MLAQYSEIANARYWTGGQIGYFIRVREAGLVGCKEQFQFIAGETDQAEIEVPKLQFAHALRRIAPSYPDAIPEIRRIQ